MADVKVNRESSESRGQQGQRGGAVARRGEHYPNLFSLSPREFFSMSPFQLMRRFSEDLDRAFSGGREWIGGRGLWAPAVEVRQEGTNMVVRADLPGLSKDDVKVEVTDEGLAISGERKHEQKEEREGYYHSEFSYGQFYRLIPLPEGANLDQSKANFNNGVLEVRVPVAQAEQRRKEIPIESGGGTQTRTSGGGA